MRSRRKALSTLFRFATWVAGMAGARAAWSGGFGVAPSQAERTLPKTDGAPPRRDFMFFEAWIDAGSVVPPVKAPAGGSMRATLYPDTGVLEWRVTLARMTGPETQAAFHGPATDRENAPAVIVLPPFELLEDRGARELQGRSKLTLAQIDDLIAERWYVSASTAAHPDGELRGQIKTYRGGVHGG